MNIGIIGPTGNIGSRTMAEALARGHHVTAIVRDVARIAPSDAPNPASTSRSCAR